MRSKLLFLIVLIVALATFCGTASANLLPNPSMEDPCSGPPEGWWTWGSSADGYGISVQEFLDNSAEARTGRWYGHALSPNPDDYANILPPWTPVEEGKKYYAGIYVKDVQPGGSNTPTRIEFLYSTTPDGSGRDDQYQHFAYGTIANDGQYNLLSGESMVIPTGIVAMCTGFNSQDDSEYYVDDYYLDTTRPAGSSGVHSPEPENGAKVLPPIGSFPSPITLKWTKEKGQKGDELVIEDVWWNAGSADCNDNNFEAEKDPTPLPHTDPNTALAAIDAEKDYYWRVDVIDPNGGNGGVGTLIGPVWYFSSVNSPPEVDAGIKQAMWQDSGANPVTFQLAPTVSDDGLPVPPGSLTYDWDAVAGVIFDPCELDGSSTAEAPTATMDPAFIEDPCDPTLTVPADFMLTLNVDDGSGPVSDTVKLRVYANNETGLEARYDIEESNAAPGLHDDYSGYDRNPTPVVNPPTRRGERMDDIGTPGTTGTFVDTTGGKIAQPEQNPSDLTDGGLVFNGGTGYVQASNSLGEPNENAPGGAVRTWADPNEVSVAAWIKIEEGNFDKAWQSIICNGNTSYRLQRSGGGSNLQFSCNITADDGSTSTVSAASSDIVFDDGEWHHVMGTYDGVQIAIYVDGLLEGSNPGEGTIDIGNDWLTYGHNLGWLATDEDEDGIRDGDDTVTDSTFNGTMDEIRIHSIGLPWRSDNPGNPETPPLDGNNARSVVSIYRTSEGHDNCGGNYLPGDIDESCYVDLADAKIMAEEWLDCSSIDRERCDEFWRD